MPRSTRSFFTGRFLFLLTPTALLAGLSGCSQTADKPAAATTEVPAADSTASYPAADGFDRVGSDAQALALADRVMQHMGGYPAWQQTRLLGWDFLDGSYQLWDKQTGDFRWQKDSLVALYNLGAKQGHVYRSGEDISATPDGRKLLENMYPIWVNNSWWLLMPFKLKDSGVTLTYQGAGKFMDSTAAEVLNMSFRNVGVTPDNRYQLFVNPKTSLVEEWAYYKEANDSLPAFRRRWSDYRRYGKLLLASDRTDGKDGRHLDHIVALDSVPAGIMTNPKLIQPL
ncbi:hypothetical protein KBK19_03275 [Microvirga sp. STR05]|uniref:Lipoprotein n=1 Tax=Hymenobacter duratus TaxID=2771356 RepID=A0ABR8JBH0_9BACT|nr:hypothetical protein [Hymenobacter duratus]MBD2714051.1 hypothetical protein [Hymenobacter duratus]MBR7948953.1 hypothetical protein [Microvirga sp. STR05]